MATQEDSGTQTCVISSEHSLSVQTAGAAYVLVLDLTNLANGDTLEVYAKTKVLSSSTPGQLFKAIYQHAQSDKVVHSIPCPSVHSIEFFLKQTAGTGRNIDWSVIKL